jgi:hypothetical protein
VASDCSASRAALIARWLLPRTTLRLAVAGAASASGTR